MRLKRFIWICLFLTIFIYLVIYQFQPTVNFLKSDLENTSLCRMPVLPLWPQDWKFSRRSVDCLRDARNWVYVSKGRIIYRDTFFQQHGGFTCKQAQASSKSFEDAHNNSRLLHDVADVACKASDGEIFYTTLLGVVPLKGRVDQGVEGQRNKSWQLRKDGLDLDIIMFGFDSVSRLMWQRELPKTVKKLKSMGAVVLEAYNILGDGTPQALLPILTGKTEMELPETRKGFPNATTVDGHPWIWKELKRRGYVTQWGEDNPSVGTFTYRMYGFQKPPVDHYMEPFHIHTKMGFCYDQLPSHHLFFNYLRELINVYGPSQRKFSFLFHSIYSHDTDSYLSQADDDLVQLLSDLETSGVLEHSLLILMADHGARFSKFRQTEQGKYEERLPFMSLRLPQNKKFKARFPYIHSHLSNNVHRLTSPFDIHATFMDVLYYNSQKGPHNTLPYPRGISLFRPIPEERMCDDIGIEDHWCACMRHTPYPLDHPLTLEMASFVVQHINTLLTPVHSLCAPLRLRDVKAAAILKTNKNLLAFKQSADRHGRQADLSDSMASSFFHLMITLTTLPNHATYEATVSKNPLEVKQISRTNKYGNQPICIMDKHPHLRPYCYCL